MSWLGLGSICVTQEDQVPLGLELYLAGCQGSVHGEEKEAVGAEGAAHTKALRLGKRKRARRTREHSEHREPRVCGERGVQHLSSQVVTS